MTQDDGFFLPRVVTRFLFRSQSIGVLPWLTLFALLSVALGVATLIIVLSVMNGFSTTLQQQLVGIYSPLRIYPGSPGQIHFSDVKTSLKGIEDVTEVIGVIKGDVLIKSGSDQYQGGRAMAFSKWRNDRLPVKKPPDDGVYLGKQLASELWILPGDVVTLIRPRAQSTPFGPLPGG
ncbi:MAG: ABC transporter permease, partial [bacterium]